MMIRGFLKTAAAAAAIASLPASAIAATPAASLSVADTVRAGAVMEEESEQFRGRGFTRYAIPAVIVIVIVVAVYLAFIDDDESSISV